MPEKVKSSPWYWITGSDGKKSMSATLALVAFSATTVAYILSIFEKIGPLTIRSFDVAACAVFLTPALGLYFGRKTTELSAKNKEKPADEVVGEK